ncbi:hypothetical protein ETR_09066 [Erwinia tracheiphila PSU-1]|nr:hypothetical protein ETR_09066 [Erwinia tracheiphila PSU-1]
MHPVPTNGGKWDADALGNFDNGDLPEDIAVITPLIASISEAANQPFAFIEMQCRNSYTTALGNITGCQFTLVQGMMFFSSFCFTSS